MDDHFTHQPSHHDLPSYHSTTMRPTRPNPRGKTGRSGPIHTFPPSLGRAEAASKICRFWRARKDTPESKCFKKFLESVRKGREKDRDLFDKIDVKFDWDNLWSFYNEFNKERAKFKEIVWNYIGELRWVTGTDKKRRLTWFMRKVEPPRRVRDPIEPLRQAFVTNVDQKFTRIVLPNRINRQSIRFHEDSARLDFRKV